MKPNILFIMTDQLRYDALGCTGGWVSTPHIDRIARGGAIFDNCITNSPVCIPARLSLARGQYPHNTGIWKNGEHTPRPTIHTWMKSVRDEGYRTSLFGKTHLHPHAGDLRDREHLLRSWGIDDSDEIAGPRASAYTTSNMTDLWEKNGFLQAYRDDYDERFSNKPYVVRPSVLPFELYADVYVARKASEYLRDYDRPEPWCCWLSFGGPHEPWDTPEPFASYYQPDDMPNPIPRAESLTSPASDVLNKLFRKFPDGMFSPDDVAKCRANYAGNVTLIDEQIGKVLEIIEERGELSNTAVILTSDHGEQNGDHGLIYKESFLESSVKIPLIIKLPENEPASREGVRYSVPVELMDAGATIAELAGCEHNPKSFAVSLLQCFECPDTPVRAEAISEYDGEICLIDSEWKFAVNRNGVPYLLIDRHNDRLEQNNLVYEQSYREVIQTLSRRILQRIVSTQLQLV